ncbi:MAG: hypothetical protein AAGI70_00960 [Pseudomonadota bacterium]
MSDPKKPEQTDAKDETMLELEDDQLEDAEGGFSMITNRIVMSGGSTMYEGALANTIDANSLEDQLDIGADGGHAIKPTSRASTFLRKRPGRFGNI